MLRPSVVPCRSWLRAVVCSSLLLNASCGENTGSPPPTGFSTQVADYSTPEERIAQELRLPQVDLAQAEADQANPEPFPLGEFTCTAGTLVRLRGEVLRIPEVFHYPPLAIVRRSGGDPNRRTIDNRMARWGKLHRATGRHEYTIELQIPSTPGQYEVVLTSQHLIVATNEKGPRFDLGRMTLKVQPAPKKSAAP